MRQGGDVGERRTRGVGPRAVRNAAWAGALVCALAAGWAPHVTAGGGPTTRVLVADLSSSVGGAIASGTLERARAELGGEDRFAVVVFGERARIALEPGSPDRALPALPVGPHGSDVSAALALAARMAAAERAVGRRVEVVLATDGKSTSAGRDEMRAAIALAGAGCADFATEELVSAAPTSLATRVAGPGRVARGEPFVLEVHGIAGPGGAQVELLRADALEDSRAVPSEGPFRVLFARVEEATGPVEYRARVAGATTVPPAATTVVVTHPGSVLVFGAPAPVALREELLQDARRLAPSELGALDGALAGHAAVVVVNTPDALLSAPVVTALERYAERGGRVLLVGGADAFGPGHWAGRPIERISPLLARAPDDTGLLLYVGLDGSGSMATPWGGPSGATSQDAVVRDAARALVRSAAPDTTLVLRRFAGELLPAGVPAMQFLLDDDGCVAAENAVAGLAPPGGATALLPPLDEARSVMAARGGGARHVLVLTDGRIADEPEAVRLALRALGDAGVGVTLAIPGGAEPGDRLQGAVEGTGAVIVRAERPADLARIFRRVEGDARQAEPIVTGRDLVPGSSAAAWLPDGSEWPRANRIDRTWPAPGCAVLVETRRGEPVIATRAIGSGRVVGVGTLPGDPDWLDDSDATRRLVRGLARLIARPVGADVRVEREGGRLLVRWQRGAGALEPPHALAWTTRAGAVRRSPLGEGPGGLFEAPLGGADTDGDGVVRLLSESGAEIAAFGLERPVPEEYRSDRRLDLAGLSRLATGPDRSRRLPLRPWFAAAAVLLLLGGSVVSLEGRIPSRTG